MLKYYGSFTNNFDFILENLDEFSIITQYLIFDSEICSFLKIHLFQMFENFEIWEKLSTNLAKTSGVNYCKLGFLFSE